MNPYRFLIALIVLLPYMVFYRFDKQETPWWLDMLVAMAAFGLGHLLFPDKKRLNKDIKKEDKNVLDQ